MKALVLENRDGHSAVLMEDGRICQIDGTHPVGSSILLRETAVVGKRGGKLRRYPVVVRGIAAAAAAAVLLFTGIGGWISQTGGERKVAQAPEISTGRDSAAGQTAEADVLSSTADTAASVREVGEEPARELAKTETVTVKEDASVSKTMNRSDSIAAVASASVQTETAEQASAAVAAAGAKAQTAPASVQESGSDKSSTGAPASSDPADKKSDPSTKGKKESGSSGKKSSGNGNSSAPQEVVAVAETDPATGADPQPVAPAPIDNVAVGSSGEGSSEETGGTEDPSTGASSEPAAPEAPAVSEQPAAPAPEPPAAETPAPEPSDNAGAGSGATTEAAFDNGGTDIAAEAACEDLNIGD